MTSGSPGNMLLLLIASSLVMFSHLTSQNVVLVVASASSSFDVAPPATSCDKLLVHGGPVVFLPPLTEDRPFQSPFPTAEVSGIYRRMDQDYPPNHPTFLRVVPKYNTKVYIWVCRSRWVFTFESPRRVGECDESYVILSSTIAASTPSASRPPPFPEEVTLSNDNSMGSPSSTATLNTSLPLAAWEVKYANTSASSNRINASEMVLVCRREAECPCLDLYAGVKSAILSPDGVVTGSQVSSSYVATFGLIQNDGVEDEEEGGVGDEDHRKVANTIRYVHHSTSSSWLPSADDGILLDQPTLGEMEVRFQTAAFAHWLPWMDKATMAFNATKPQWALQRMAPQEGELTTTPSAETDYAQFSLRHRYDLVYDSSHLFSPQLLGVNNILLKAVRRLSTAEKETVDKSLRLTMNCSSRCLTSTKSQTLRWPVLPLLWRWTFPSGRTDFVHLQNASEETGRDPTLLAATPEYASRSVSSLLDGTTAEISTSSATSQRLTVRWNAPAGGQKLYAQWLHINGSLVPLLPASTALSNFFVLTPVRAWFAAVANAAATSMDSNLRPWTTLSPVNFATTLETVGSATSDAHVVSRMKAVFGELATDASSLSKSVVAIGATVTQVSVRVPPFPALVSRRAARQQLDGTTILPTDPSDARSMLWEDDRHPALRISILLTSNATMVPTPAFIGAPCGCLAVSINGILVADVVTPKCDEAFLVTVRSPAVRGRQGFFGQYSPGSGTGAAASAPPHHNPTVSLRKTCANARPLSIAAVVIDEDTSSAAATTEDPSPLMCIPVTGGAFGSSGEFRLGCNCSLAPDGAWCGVGQSCFAGVCSQCQRSRRGDHLSSFGSSGWDFSLGRCTIALVDALPLQTASQLCRDHGADLPSVPHAEYLPPLVRQLQQVGRVSGWVGAVWDATTWQLRWTDGTPTSSTSNETVWDTGEPLASLFRLNALTTNQRLCGSLLVATGKLRLDYCTSILSVVCQRVMCDTVQAAPVIRPAAGSSLMQFRFDGMVAESVGAAGNRNISTSLLATAGLPAALTPTLLRPPMTPFYPLSMQPGGLEFVTDGRYDGLTFCVAADDYTPCPGTVRLDSLRLSVLKSDGITSLWTATAEVGRCHSVAISAETSLRLQVTQLSPTSRVCDAVDWVRPQFCRYDTFAEDPCPVGWLLLSHQRCVLPSLTVANYTEASRHCARACAGCYVSPVLTASQASFFVSRMHFQRAWAGVRTKATLAGVFWFTDFGEQWEPPTGLSAFASSTPQPGLDLCLVASPDGASMQSIRCDGEQTFPFYCETSSSSSETTSLSETFSDDVQGGLSETASIEVTETAAMTLTTSLETTESTSLDVTDSVSGATFSTSVDSDTVSVTETQSETPAIVPGNISRVSAPEVSFHEITFFSYKLRLMIEGDAFQSNLQLGTDFFLRSSLWDENWGKGVAQLSAEQQKRKDKNINQKKDDNFFSIEYDVLFPQWLNITFGPDTTYAPQIVNDEALQIDFAPTAFRSGVMPRGLPMTLSVTADHTCGPICRTRRAARYLTLLLFLLQVLSGGDFAYLLEYLTVIVFLEADCNAEAELLPFALHPLQLHIGSAPYRFSYGAAVCNSSILLGLLLIHIVATLVTKRVRGLSHFGTAAADTYFPSLLYFPFAMLSPGVAIGVAVLLGFGAAEEKILAICMSIAWFAMLVLLTPMLRTRRFNARFVAAKDSLLPSEEQNDIAYKAFFPLGEWFPADRDFTFVDRYRWCFSDYLPGTSWFGIYHVCVVSVLAVIQSVRAFQFSTCVIITGSLSTVLFMHMLMIVFLRPFRRRAHTVVSVVVSLIVGASIGTQVGSWFWPSVIDNRTPALLTALFCLSAAMIVWLVVRISQLLRWTKPFPELHSIPQVREKEAFSEDTSALLLEAMLKEAENEKAKAEEEEKRIRDMKEAKIEPSRMMRRAAVSMRRQKEKEMDELDSAARLGQRQFVEAQAEAQRKRRRTFEEDDTLQRLLKTERSVVIEQEMHLITPEGTAVKKDGANDKAIRHMSGSPTRLRLDSDYRPPERVEWNAEEAKSMLHRRGSMGSAAGVSMSSSARLRAAEALSPKEKLDHHLDSVSFWGDLSLDEPLPLGCDESSASLGQRCFSSLKRAAPATVSSATRGKSLRAVASSLGVSMDLDPPRATRVPDSNIPDPPRSRGVTTVADLPTYLSGGGGTNPLDVSPNPTGHITSSTNAANIPVFSDEADDLFLSALVVPISTTTSNPVPTATAAPTTPDGSVDHTAVDIHYVDL